jgi:hypothetical protein
MGLELHGVEVIKRSQAASTASSTVLQAFRVFTGAIVDRYLP